jgi:threonine dehydrogenase-like Zn-dependent dehydrogenase
LVMLSGAAGCGACARCLQGDAARCTRQPLQVYGLGHALQGCQAEAVRVPVVDFNVARIPDGVSLDQALMLTDALPTAWYGCVNADIGPGKSVAVVGLGPIGLAAIECAFVMGAARVFAIDPVPQRRERARALGALPLTPEQAQDEIREATHGAMLECVVEAVGAEASIKQALRLAALGGAVSVIGAPRARHFNFPMAFAMERSLTFRIGICSPARWWPVLVPLVQQGRLRVESSITHRLPLAAGSEAYRLFDQRLEGVLKTVLVP